MPHQQQRPGLVSFSCSKIRSRRFKCALGARSLSHPHSVALTFNGNWRRRRLVYLQCFRYATMPSSVTAYDCVSATTPAAASGTSVTAR